MLARAIAKWTRTGRATIGRGVPDLSPRLPFRYPGLSPRFHLDRPRTFGVARRWRWRKGFTCVLAVTREDECLSDTHLDD